MIKLSSLKLANCGGKKRMFSLQTWYLWSSVANLVGSSWLNLDVPIERVEKNNCATESLSFQWDLIWCFYCVLSFGELPLCAYNVVHDIFRRLTDLTANVWPQSSSLCSTATAFTTRPKDRDKEAFDLGSANFRCTTWWGQPKQNPNRCVLCHSALPGPNSFWVCSAIAVAWQGTKTKAKVLWQPQKTPWCSIWWPMIVCMYIYANRYMLLYKIIAHWI